MELTAAQITELREAAKAGSKQTYSPYSNFPVGAAILAGSGSIYVGCNIENASYGLSNCAERTAIFSAVVAGERSVLAVAVYTPTTTITTPCGACRQVINEFGPNAWCFAFSERPEPLVLRLSELLPQAFGPHNLG